MHRFLLCTYRRQVARCFSFYTTCCLPPLPSCRYCGEGCSHTDWRAGHKRFCEVLAEERRQQRAKAAAAAVE